MRSMRRCFIPTGSLSQLQKDQESGWLILLRLTLHRSRAKALKKNRSLRSTSAPVAIVISSSLTEEKAEPEDSCRLLGWFDLNDKFQITNSKQAPSSNSQWPKHFRLWFWIFEIGDYLRFGAWNLVLTPSDESGLASIIKARLNGRDGSKGLPSTKIVQKWAGGSLSGWHQSKDHCAARWRKGEWGSHSILSRRTRSFSILYWYYQGPPFPRKDIEDLGEYRPRLGEENRNY